MNDTRKELTVEECKTIALDILKYISRVCEENGLRYYLAYGTLLGAVRHSGFIPWDDDIDVFMPYEDYLKLVEIESQKENGRYKLISRETNSEFTAPLAKMVDSHTELYQNYGLIEKVPLGVYVDIFILCGTGNTPDEAAENTKESCGILAKWLMAATVAPEKCTVRSLLSRIRRAPYTMRGYKYYLDKIEKFRTGREFDRYSYVTQASLLSVSSVRKAPMKSYILKKEDFGAGTDIAFEGCRFTAPQNYDALLTAFYGDYMKLPPEEKRITNHNYHAYRK